MLWIVEVVENIVHIFPFLVMIDRCLYLKMNTDKINKVLQEY